MSSLGKLSLAIPWSNLYTKPVVVKIEDVFVVAAPVTGMARRTNLSIFLSSVLFELELCNLCDFAERDFDAERAEERLRAAKKRKLLAIDKSTVLQNDETSEESQLPDDYTLFEKLTAQVIKNVQVFFWMVVKHISCCLFPCANSVSTLMLCVQINFMVLISGFY